MQRIKAGIVGAGGFGGYRRERLRESGLYELLGSFDINPAAMQAAQKDDGARPCASYDELLAMPGLEAIFVSTGGKFHAEQALAAMRKGLHVFIEKPLCSTMDEVKALYDAQRKNGVVVGVGHGDHRSDPICMLIKACLADGRIGKLAAIEYNSSHSGGLAGKPTDWRFDPEKNPGGMLFQCGVHALHEMMYLFGPVTEVAAFMRYDVHITKTADTAQTLLRFQDGLTATLNCYHVTAYNHRFRLFGTHGNLYINTHEQRAFYQERKQNETEPEVELKLPSHDAKLHRCGNVISFARTIRGEEQQTWPGLDEGARAVAVVFACEQSSRERRTVSVALPDGRV